jgi:hypothetical protein
MVYCKKSDTKNITDEYVNMYVNSAFAFFGTDFIYVAHTLHDASATLFFCKAMRIIVLRS